jgi:putative ABC transport system ATP-binding protein
MIKLENVEKYYGNQRVLRGIHLEVKRGEFVSIIGSSGSGKSTLLNLIGGMDKPEQGKIIVEGKELTRYSDNELTLYRRKKIGFVFQFFNLLPNITVSENIAMPLLLSGHEDGGKVIEYIEKVGLRGKEDRYPYQLSGGEQQRVAIARALVHDPSIILADEPTGNLDSETGKGIMEIIKKFIGDATKTVILVSHEAYIADYAERTVRIKDGMLFS